MFCFHVIMLLGLFASCFAEKTTMNKEDTRERVELHNFNADNFDANDPFRKHMLTVTPGYPMYYFSFHNWPSNNEIFVSKRNIVEDFFNKHEKSTYIPYGKFIIREDGSIDDNGKPGLPYFWFSSNGYAPGERVHVFFQTFDWKFSKELTWIPIPIIAKNKEGTITLEAELVIVVPTVYRIFLKGLKNGQHYTMQSTSGDESITKKLIFSEEDAMTIAPAVIGLSGGTAKVSIIISEEVLTLNLPWGKNIADYITGKKIYKP